MTYINDSAECAAYGAMIHSKGLRLDDQAVKSSIKDTGSCKYYVSAKQGKAFKASLVVAGYWEAVNGSEEVEGLDF